MNGRGNKKGMKTQEDYCTIHEHGGKEGQVNYCTSVLQHNSMQQIESSLLAPFFCLGSVVHIW